MEKPKVFFVLGGPGAGKGTQCAKLVAKYKVIHLSAGELLREERNRKTECGDMIEEIMLSGGIVPSFITVRLLDEAMTANGLQNSFLIDGFPRNEENLNTWLKLMGDKVAFKKLLYFDCDEETLTNRVKGRAAEEGRKDDNAETLLKRFQTFNTSTKKIIEYFTNLDQVIHIAAKNTVDEVFKQIENKVSELI